MFSSAKARGYMIHTFVQSFNFAPLGGSLSIFVHPEALKVQKTTQ